jgi:serine protease Do
MKKSLNLSIVILVMISMVLAACAPAAPAATAVPTQAPAQPTATDAPKPEPTKAEPTKIAATQPPAAPKNLVTSLDDVKGATIQIQSQGTFIDPQVGEVVNGAGRGSGFIIDSSGIAVTNNHVVTGAALLKVWVGGNRDKVYNARVLGASECSDLAVIQLEGSNFPYLAWHDGAPKVGLEVYAAGYPLGDPEFTLTKGIISKAATSGKTSWASVGSVLEHDARINPGNSGGPLVDKDGKVVGINYASNQANQYFAIAKAEADSVISQLQAGKDVNSIGVNGQVIITTDKTLSGVWVSSVKSGSPADKSGVKAGDIITQLEGLVLGTDGTAGDYCQILRSHQPTDTLSMNILRWKAQEFLEGQLNGRQLVVTGTYSSGGGEQGGAKPSGPVTVSDNSGVITMDAPEGWEYDGSSWENTWSTSSGDIPFTAQTLTVAPNIAAYGAYGDAWKGIGIFVATSRDWANIGGYMNLLEGVRGFYKECTAVTSKPYKDDVYEGQILVYTRCGANKVNAVVMTVREIKNQSYLVLIEEKYITDADYALLDPILSSLNVNP